MATVFIFTANRTSKHPQTVSEQSGEEKKWTSEAASIRRADRTVSRAVHLVLCIIYYFYIHYSMKKQYQ
jgi:hypothetical protein